MPSTKSIEILARRSPLTPKNWVGLVEARRELIKPYLDSFSLQTLGKVPCLRSEQFLVALDELKETGGNARFSLKTQGVFSLQPFTAMVRDTNRPYPGGVKKIWGLTRAGEWVITTVRYIGTAGYKDRGREVAASIEIVEADVVTILETTGTSPEAMLQQLGQRIKDLTEHRRRLYEQARVLATLVEVDELLIRFVPEPSKNSTT